jgi:hypothetical protein
LSVGNGRYITAGVFKMLTLGGIGMWWFVDWIRILTNSFVDGQGIALLEWTDSLNINVKKNITLFPFFSSFFSSFFLFVLYSITNVSI